MMLEPGITLPEANIALETPGLEDTFPFWAFWEGKAYFQGLY